MSEKNTEKKRQRGINYRRDVQTGDLYLFDSNDRFLEVVPDPGFLVGAKRLGNLGNLVNQNLSLNVQVGVISGKQENRLETVPVKTVFVVVNPLPPNVPELENGDGPTSILPGTEDLTKLADTVARGCIEILRRIKAGNGSMRKSASMFVQVSSS